MSLYLIGDLQGCDESFALLLDTINFSPSRDHLVLLGDLINRGPANVATLHRLMNFGSSATCLLGNHDLYMLSVHHGIKQLKNGDTTQDILNAADRNRMMDWLAQQKMAVFMRGCLMVHAGVLPQWSADDTLNLAAEVEAQLRSPERVRFLSEMYGSHPCQWASVLTGSERRRVIVNGLTRLRYCTIDGEMEFNIKEGLSAAPSGYMPWFDVPERLTIVTPVVFGHWSALGAIWKPKLACIDTGCVWGRELSALRLHDSTVITDLTQQAEWFSVGASEITL
jgi:bis(5'-nucleosyl)-tetraphosphatase (symmetrical)